LLHIGLKENKHENFLKFFGENQTIWSPGPVTQDF